MLGLLLIAVSAPTARADTCEAYESGALVAELVDPLSVESSGLAASRTRPGVWFTHDDSGGEISVYAFTLDGALFEEQPVLDGLFFDWEDMAAGPCPADLIATAGERCLYIGDIGDNFLLRGYDAVFIVAEPAEGESAPVLRILRASFPDEPHDAESLFVHPLTADVYLVTKEGDGESGVWRFPPWSEAETVGELAPVASLHLSDWLTGNLMTTGADWDAEGERLVVRTYDSLLVWETDPCAPDAHWETPPLVLPQREGESGGEAVAFDLAGDLWTTAEGSPLQVSTFTCVGYVDHPLSDCGPDDTGGVDDGGGDGGEADGDSGGGDSDSATPGADGDDTAPPAGAGDEPAAADRTPKGCGCGGGRPPHARGAWLLLPLALALRSASSSRRSRSRCRSSRA